jgi:hypothetical protein
MAGMLEVRAQIARGGTAPCDSPPECAAITRPDRGSAGSGIRRIGDPPDQWIRRTNPQTWQRATPDSVSISRKLVQPLVLQYRREAALARRRRRRIAVERPATDDVVERDIMMGCVCFLARRDRVMGDRLRGR